MGFFILKGKGKIMSTTNRKSVLFTIDPSTVELLNRANESTYVPKSRIVDLALQEYLKDYQDDDSNVSTYVGIIE